MRIAVGTKNEAKVKAVTQVMRSVWPNSVIIPLSAPSGVSDMPLSDEESFTGAANRANFALQAAPDCTYAVGMEGNVQKIYGHYFLRGCVVILDQTGRQGLGQSGAVMLPQTWTDRLLQGEELGPLVQELMNDPLNMIRHTGGTNGILTGGLYNREMEFVHATQTALAPFISPELYN